MRGRGLSVIDPPVFLAFPAFGVGDQEDLPHRGFQAFIDLMDRWQPKYLVYGHVHPQYGALSFQRERVHGGTTCVNAYKRYVIEI